MPNKEFYVMQSEQDTTGLSNLMKMMGNTRTFSTGFTSFILKSFSVAFGMSAISGLGSVMLLAPSIGPIAPALLGSSAGFVYAMWHRWNIDSQEAVKAMDEFPELMQHHIMLLGPAWFADVDVEDWKKRCRRGNVKATSIAICALYGASDAIQRVRNEREEQLIRHYSSGYQE